MNARRVLIVGSAGETQMGHHLFEAASSLGLDPSFVDTAGAYEGPSLKRRLLWRLAGRRPARLRAFGDAVVAHAREAQPDIVLTTGIAPLDASALAALGRLGVRRLNFLTDDPWNEAHRAPWFLAALPHYDHVWSPRYAVMHDLRRARARRVDYLPFAYAPTVHRIERPREEEESRFEADVLLAGGADRDRVAWVEPLVRAGFRVALYGGYWQRYFATRRHARGMLDARGLRLATVTARVSLGIVRRANRDGHAMRTYEVPAMGGCLLAERTSDHERLFGLDGERVFFADTPADAVSKVRWLLANPSERERLATAAHDLVVGGRHSYADRLSAMLGAL